MIPIFALLAALAGCGTAGRAGGGIQVVATAFPVAEAAEAVGGDRASVVDLTPVGAEPHDIELTAGDLVRVHEADLLLYIGGGFQPAVERAVRDREGPSVDLLQGLDLLEPADEHAGEDGPDPHVWLDPVRFSRMVERIERALTEVDPGGASDYARNAAAYRAEVDELHATATAAFASCQRDVFVVSHAAFGYLAGRYGLVEEAIAGLSPESEPAPARLAELRALVRAAGVEVVFAERIASPRAARTLAAEAGVHVEVLDPLEGLTPGQQRAGATYLSVMRDNVTKLAQALGCD